MTVPVFSANMVVVDHQSSPIVNVDLRMHSGCVYTLHGPNASGKSTLVKAVMGLLPYKNRREGKIEIDGKPVRDFASPAQAIRRGVVAVFQATEDSLTPSMTIREQLRLRHAIGPWKLLGEKIEGWFSSGHWVSRFFERFSLSPPSLGTEAEVDLRAAALLKSYSGQGVQYEDVLDKLPRDLSGGQRAVARLVSAQLTTGIKVLLLDEVFANVQPDVWPHIVDRLRRWARDEKVAVLSITHNSEESIRWQPNERFEIDRNGTTSELTKMKPQGYTALAAGVPQRIRWYPIYEATRTHDWINHLEIDAPCVLLADSNVARLDCYTKLRDALRGRVGSIGFDEVFIDSSERMKTRQQLDDLYRKTVRLLHTRKGVVVIIGGGVVLNLAGYIGATIHRGVNTVLIPTTIMAIADVAVGSKTALNDQGPDGSLKHMQGVYANPWAVVLEPQFVQSLSTQQVMTGLSECLKHGLLQDPVLLTQVLELLLSARNPDDGWRDRAFAVARRTMQIKSDVLLVDPWEELGLGFVLLYGHLHAHSLERLTGFSIAHGLAVYVGVLADLWLAGQPMRETYHRIVAALKSCELARDNTITAALNTALAPQGGSALETAYRNDPKSQHFGPASRQFRFLKLDRPAQFADHVTNEAVSDSMQPTSFDEIVLALKQVQSDLRG